MTAASSAPASGRGGGDSGAVRITAVEDACGLDAFIRFPVGLYRGHAGYAAPLADEQRKTLRRDRNPYFQHAEARYWFAHRDGRPVGRISAQIDRLYLDRYVDFTGHFGFLDAIDDRAVFAALTGAAEDWLRARGMRRCLGPFNPSINEECGLLVQGFDAPPMLLMPYAPPYASTRLAEQGYGKARDLIAYDYDLIAARPVARQRLLDQAAAGRARVRQFDMRRYDEEIHLILEIFNDAWSDNWGFVPMTAEEIATVAAAMRPLLRSELVWFAELDGKAVGMIAALPNLAEAIRDLDGRLLPFGWLKLLWRLKVAGVKSARVPLFGVRKALHRTPLGAALALIAIESLRVAITSLGFRRAELSWILEDNMPIRRMIESVGGRAYKTYRIYEKVLA